MKVRGMWLPLLAAALAIPGALRAQEDEDCPCRRPGMIGVIFNEAGEDGVRIVEVRPGSPAARAGVREGDVVVRLNGEDAAVRMNALPSHLQAGDTVRLLVQRDEDEQEIVLVAEPRSNTQLSILRSGQGRPMVITSGLDSLHIPLQALTMRIDSLQGQLMQLHGGALRIELDSIARVFSDSAHGWAQRIPNLEFHLREGMPEDVFVQGMVTEGRPFFMELGRRAAAGAELAEMNEGLSAYFGGQQEGALVIEVAPETPAARAGLQPGDVIVRAGDEEVSDPEDVRRALNAAEAGQVELEVIRQGRRQELSLEWTGGDRWFRREVRPGRAGRPES